VPYVAEDRLGIATGSDLANDLVDLGLRTSLKLLIQLFVDGNASEQLIVLSFQSCRA
jgi:hypothetical protein